MKKEYFSVEYLNVQYRPDDLVFKLIAPVDMIVSLKVQFSHSYT